MTAGAFIGRIAEIAISSNVIDPNSATFASDIAGASFVEIEKANNPKFSSTLDTAESTNNDSGGSKEYLPTWESGTITFEMIADDSTAVVQNTQVWASYIARSTRAFRFRPRGNSAGDQQIFIGGFITNIEQSNDKGDVSKYTVSVQKTKSFVRNTQ